MTTDCIIYTGEIDPDGYGRWTVRANGHKKTLLAHRAVFELVHGPLEPSEVVRHTCDTPACVNPFHLISGTHSDNQADKVARDRQAKGERNARAKLTTQEVLDIRASTGRHEDIAARYGVSTSNISMIVSGKTWRHLLPKS